MTFDSWFLFPVSILIATTAMASGIGGAVFFSPLFMIVLKLERSVAVGTALTTAFLGLAPVCLRTGGRGSSISSLHAVC